MIAMEKVRDELKAHPHRPYTIYSMQAAVGYSYSTVRTALLELHRSGAANRTRLNNDAFQYQYDN